MVTHANSPEIVVQELSPNLMRGTQALYQLLGYNPGTGESFVLGSREEREVVFTDDQDNRHVVTGQYYTTPHGEVRVEGRGKKAYNTGANSMMKTVIQPYDAIKACLDAGLVLKGGNDDAGGQITYGAGGLDTKVLFRIPDVPGIEDKIKWDQDFWYKKRLQYHDEHPEIALSDIVVEPTLGLDIDQRGGSSLKLAYRLYRPKCWNGNMMPVYESGYSAEGANFNLNHFIEWVKMMVERLYVGHYIAPDVWITPKIGLPSEVALGDGDTIEGVFRRREHNWRIALGDLETRKAEQVQQAAMLFNLAAATKIQEDGASRRTVDYFDANEVEMPTQVRKFFRTAMSLDRHIRSNIADQFELMINAGREIRTGDLHNAASSVVSQARRDLGNRPISTIGIQRQEQYLVETMSRALTLNLDDETRYELDLRLYDSPGYIGPQPASNN